MKQVMIGTYLSSANEGAEVKSEIVTSELSRVSSEVRELGKQ